MPLFASVSSVESGLLAIANSVASTVVASRSGRSTTVANFSGARNGGLHRLGEEHLVDALFQLSCRVGRCAGARHAVELGLHLSRMRRKQQDAAPHLDRFGD